ncbi:MAG: hypothetical protein JO362_23180 [Streptomycetaceae bacterium]|nr:hypothetical protein [Streptomycetaceae bacterium]
MRSAKRANRSSKWLQNRSIASVVGAVGLRKVTIGHLPENCPVGYLQRTSVLPDLTNQ